MGTSSPERHGDLVNDFHENGEQRRHRLLDQVDEEAFCGFVVQVEAKERKKCLTAAAAAAALPHL